MRNLLTLTLAVTTFAACTPYPEHGFGGFAEHQRFTHNHAYHPAFSVFMQSKSPQAGWAHDNVKTVACYDSLLAELRQHGANKYFPGQVWLIEKQRNRVLRLFTGGLAWDGESEMTKLHNMLYTLKHQLHANEHDTFTGTDFKTGEKHFKGTKEEHISCNAS